MTQDEAEVVALTALAWLAADEDLLPVFLGSTGASAEDLKAGACDPAFLGAVLDFLTMDDAWIGRMADETGLPASAPLSARQALPGGASPHWT